MDRLAKFGIPVIHDKIERALGENGQFQSVLTEDGLEIELDALFCTQGATPEVQLAKDLGVSLFTNGYIDTDIEQRTNVAGRVRGRRRHPHPRHQITTAVHEGATAASAANYYLYPPELKADSARQHPGSGSHCRYGIRSRSSVRSQRGRPPWPTSSPGSGTTRSCPKWLARSSSSASRWTRARRRRPRPSSS